MHNCPLIDLNTAPLRDHWTEEDFQFLLKHKERLFVLSAVLSLPRRVSPNGFFDLEHQFVLVNQRRPTAEDSHDGFDHARDLSLTGSAYRELSRHIFEYVEAGHYVLPPGWRTRFHDIAALYDEGRIPDVMNYPLVECGGN